MNYKKTLLLLVGNLNEEECKIAIEILSNEREVLGKHEQKKKKCNPRGTILKCDFDHNLECKDCPQFY